MLRQLPFFVISIASLLLGFLGCKNSDKYLELKIGMTYNEVEKILDKPSAISRGANELHYNINSLPQETFKKLNLEPSDDIKDTLRWITPKEIETVGELIYVTWVYDKSITDTYYVLVNTFRERIDTIKKTIPIYFVGNKQVSKSEYDKSDGYEYRLENGKIVEKYIYYYYQKSGLYKLPTPKKIGKSIKYKNESHIYKTEEKDSTKKEYYTVKSKFCVIFDASSGRVSHFGYFPFEIKQMEDTGKKDFNNKTI